MKKIISVLLAVTCMFSMAACSTTKDDKKEDKKAVTAKIIDLELTSEQYAFGVDKTQPELLEKTNAFLKKIMDDGTFADVCDHYFGSGEPVAVESAQQDTSKDQLVVATNAEFEPFEYTQGDKYYGIDMEIAALLAKELNKELVIVNMDFDAVCLSVGQQKCDIAMAGLTISEDRKEHVTFSDSYYNAAQKLVVRSDNEEFDGCADAAAVETILKGKDKSTKIGFQSGTTAQHYTEGNQDYEGFAVEAKGYKNGSLAVQDMLNGNIDYVIIDAAPADAITKAINEMR